MPNFKPGAPVDDENPMPTVGPSTLDPIFDHDNGTRTSVAQVSITVITPPAACRYMRVSADVGVFLHTAGGTAGDNAASIEIFPGMPEVLPVTEAVAVKAFSPTGTAVVRCTPFKVR